MAATVTGRRLEQRRDWTQPATPARRRGEVVVVDGFGVQVRVERGRLLIQDGAGRHRRTWQIGRAGCRLERLVVLGAAGSISLAALQWLADQGAALVCVDRDGRLLCTSAPSRSEAKLRHAQALAPHTGAGLAVARYLLGGKLEGQLRLLDRLPAADGYSRRVLTDAQQAVENARSVQEAVGAEAKGAAAYWRAWAPVEVRFRPGDRRRVPEHWLRFGSRQSPITNSPRQAVTVAGASLNFLYGLLEVEARLACVQLGLDPALAVIHADIRGRDSIPPRPDGSGPPPCRPLPARPAR
jgi:CRISPR-associated endonuclease Cas1